MYNKETLQSYASFSEILKLLKRDLSFNKYCSQQRITKGSTFLFDENMNTCYLLESGYVKNNYISEALGSNGPQIAYITSSGNLINLPLLIEERPKKYEIVALTDVIWWKIDFDYIRKILLTEDPKNFIIFHFALETRNQLFTLLKKYSLSKKNSIYYSLLSLVTYGIQIKENQVELPLFITYDILADLSFASKTYTSEVLKDLRKAGILLSSKKPWIITDIHGLKNLIDVPYLVDLV
ncbi:Crp/Fnr family transcriptional regulator [Listeria monocytogenes]|nr:Crp/Fnr family transcriptional regulator [Listeria monocytogenes]ECJ9745801.1 Crp/Fnr family transcriptional regulator [Listeria monocytogenes]EEO3379163.1 Crp/Fnr family transcriptional regulator [Listeria monocytogenes]EEO6566270.1 Crp/Fnr family transcriptional regulator [Listeria monocytogenes]EEO6725535.1 Crp/Fnr family transcriptional regulator [Listeria monocytogenes]